MRRGTTEGGGEKIDRMRGSQSDKQKMRKKQQKLKPAFMHPKHSLLRQKEERLVLTPWEPFDKHGYLNRNMRHILQTPGRIGLTFHSSFSVS